MEYSKQSRFTEGSETTLFFYIYKEKETELMANYDTLLDQNDTVNELLARYGVKFGIYKNMLSLER